MKKLLMFGLLLIPVLGFTGCSMMSSFSEDQNLNSQEVTNYEFNIKQAKEEYKLCKLNSTYYGKHKIRCNSAKLALKDTGNL